MRRRTTLLACVALALPAALVNWTLALVGIGFLVFIHELGHFLAAKFMGMPVEIFSLGFGPRLVGFRWRETDVRLSALPLGGFVKLAGFNPEEPGAEDPYGFLNQPYWKRMLFYSGGILANLLAALLLLYVISVDASRTTSADPVPSPLLVVQVVPDSPAAQAGLQPGDQIDALGDLAFPSASDRDAVAYIEARAGQPIPLSLTRGLDRLALTIIPRQDGSVGRIGIRFQPTAFNLTRRPLETQDFLRAVPVTLKSTWVMGSAVITGFWKLFSLQTGLKELGGPITILRVSNEAAKAGWITLLQMIAFISVNLAVLNALPIPFLDGGHMAILSFERLRRKDLTIELKERILTGGFYFLVSLMALVIALDLWRLKR